MTYDAQADNLRRQSEAARCLVDALRDEGHDDETVTDTVEGETTLYEAIEIAIAEIDECEIMGLGLASKIGDFSARKVRAEKRVDRLRGLIEQAMVIADMRSLKLNVATLTVKDVPPKALVSDEAAIPAEFWKQPDPVIDKTAINAAIKAGRTIPGVSMSNGTTSFQIRRA